MIVSKDVSHYDAHRIPVEDTPYRKKADSRTAAPADPDLEEMLRRFRISGEETLTSLRKSAGVQRTRRKR